MKKLLPVRPSQRPSPSTSRLDDHINTAKREKESLAANETTTTTSSQSESESATVGSAGGGGGGFNISDAEPNDRAAVALQFKKRSTSQSKLGAGNPNLHMTSVASSAKENRASNGNDKRTIQKTLTKGSDADQPKFSLQGDLFILDKKVRDWKKVYCTVDQNMLFTMWENNKREKSIDKIDLKSLTSPYHVFDNNEYNDLIWNEHKFGFQILTTV
jgi:hypothetical protein